MKITLTFFVSFKGKKCMIINYTYLHIMLLRFHQNDIKILHYIYDFIYSNKHISDSKIIFMKVETFRYEI